MDISGLTHLWEDGQVPYQTLSFILHFYFLLSLKPTHTHTHTSNGATVDVVSLKQTLISLCMTTAHLNANVIFLDCLQPLLTSPLYSQYNFLHSGGTLGQTMKHSLYMTSSNYHMVNLVNLFVCLFVCLAAS